MKNWSIFAGIVSATALAAGLYASTSQAQSLGCGKEIFITSMVLNETRTVACNDGSAEGKITRINSPIPGQNRYKITANLKLAGAFSATSNIIRPSNQAHCSAAGTPTDQNPTPQSVVDKTCIAVNPADAQRFRLTAGDAVGN